MEWISIKERYPKSQQEVLVAIEYNEIPIQAYWDSKFEVWRGSAEVRDWMKDGYVNDSNLNLGGIGAEITHWMPLPETPTKQ